VSDFCGFHHRTQLIHALVKLIPHVSISNADLNVETSVVDIEVDDEDAQFDNEYSHLAVQWCISCPCCSILCIEWKYLNELITRYPGHECLWMYRRSLFYTQLQQWKLHETQTKQLTYEYGIELIQQEIEYAYECAHDQQTANYKEQKR
jgi:hypothetical protein